MKRKPTLYSIAFLVLLLAVIFWLQPSKQHVETPQVDQPELRDSRAQDLAMNLQDREKAERISPRNWTPPVVFAQIGTPTPEIPYVRGQNAQRVYQDPKTQEVDEKLALRPPAVLAKTPEDGRTYLRADEIDLHTLIARRMVLDTTALDAVVAGNTSRLFAPSTGDEVLTLEIYSVKTRSAQSYTLKGRIAGEPEFSDVQLVYHDGIIHGTVARYNVSQHIEYRMLPDGHMMVRELDPSTMTSRCGNGPHTETACNHDHSGDAKELLNDALGEELQIIPQAEGAAPAGASEPPPGGEVAAETTGWTTVDVVVGYDQGARITQGGYAAMEALIIASIDRMSTAFSNSAIVNTEMMLLGTIEDPDYVFGGTVLNDMGDELNDLKGLNNGRLDAVSDLATQLGADFMAFVLKQADGSAGLANRPGNSSITARDYMTSNRITFAHELGHNLGCDHSWGDSSQAFKPNYGWRIDPDASVAVRTIMAYDWGWGNGDRIPHYSNPNVSFGGVPTGTVGGYDVALEPRADQRYRQGGLGYTGSNTTLKGFDGTNAALAANNADGILNGTNVESRTDYGTVYASNRATRAANAVISPVASTNWSTGKTQSVYFVGGDHTDLATVELYKNGLPLNPAVIIASGINPAYGRGTSWTLPSSLATGSDYKIRVTLGHEGGGTTSFDSSTFAITNMVANTVAILSPNGGGSYQYGDAVPITWTSGLSGNVKIELLRGGANPVVLSANETDDGYFLWSILPTLTVASNYTIRISSVSNSSYNDVSNANFSIILPPSSNTITLPYAESFESGFGKWAQSTDDDSDWTRRTGTTPSNYGYTGPSGAQEGSYYIYTEADGNYNKLFEISSWVNLVGVAGSELIFKYHMSETYVSQTDYMGSLYLDITTDGTTWTNIFTRSGNQGTSWLSATVDLSAYTNQYVKLRFRGVTGNWVASDICLDNISIVATGYAVTYVGTNSDGGSPPTDSTVYAPSATVTVLGNTNSLTRSGYTFNGWNTVSNGTGTGYTAGNTFTINSNQNLYAQWTSVPTYTVTFHGNGHDSGSPPSSQTKTQGVGLILSDANSQGMSRNGYTFTGWDTVQGGGGDAYADGATYTANTSTTLYAQWALNTYTVSYNGNTNSGGSAPGNQIKTHGNNLTLAGAGTLVKTGYSFSGWNTVALGGGDSYAGGGTYSANEATTLYAQWTADTYTITFNANGGGSPTPGSMSVTYDSTYGTLASVSRTGYTFLGWFTLAVGGSEITAATTVAITANQTLYAHWNEKPVVSAGSADTVYMTGTDADWTPADATTSLTAWYDASDSNNLLLSGQNVTNWKDISGNGYDLDQSPTDPVYDGSQINGLNVIHFANTFAELYRSGIPDINCTEVCIISIGEPKAAGDYPAMGTVYNTDSSDKLLARLNNNDLQGRAACSLKLDGSAISMTSGYSADIVDDAPVMLAAYYDGFNGVARVNGGTLSQTTNAADGATFTINEIQVGRDSNTPLNYQGEMIVLNTADSATIQKVEGYIAWKWGMQAKLPAAHPYSTTNATSGPKKSVPSATVTLAGTVTDSDNTPSVTWSYAGGGTGTGTVTFADINDLNTTVTFSGTGTYELILTVDDGFTQVEEVVVVTVNPPNPYMTWSGSSDVGVDSNGDGIDNGVAWVLGASNASANATSLLPVSDNTSDTSNFIFTYRRNDSANTDANTTIAVEYSSDLTTWTEALDSSPDIIITETNDGYGAGVDKVEVKIKRTVAVGEKLFSRLSVNITP